MKFNSQKHHRRSIRLKNYDYAGPGGYFITIVTYQRDLLFGKIVNEEMQLSDYGRIGDECWRAIPDHSNPPSRAALGANSTPRVSGKEIMEPVLTARQGVSKETRDSRLQRLG